MLEMGHLQVYLERYSLDELAQIIVHFWYILTINKCYAYNEVLLGSLRSVNHVDFCIPFTKRFSDEF